MRFRVQILYELAPVIADIISAHCPGTRAREDFLQACVHGHWSEAAEMVEGMLAEPWHLKGYQEARLREFLQLMQMGQGVVLPQSQPANQTGV
jgi:hypothetical protein